MIPFVKAHAFGNDFLLLEEKVADRKHADLARKLCNRNTSIGADGIEFLERKPHGELFLRLFNADGSEAELSGNGTRCVAAWLASTEQRQQVVLGTYGGPRICDVEGVSGSTYTIRTGMGVPRLMPRTILLEGVGEVAGTMVNVGNPHFVIFVETDDFSSHGLSWQKLGSRISTDRLFPHGTNVEFVKILSPEEIAFRIYERGCGPTTSSGTGTCASSAAAIAFRHVGKKLTAMAEGGAQQVDWTEPDAEMKLTGPAELICQGEAF